MKMPENNKVSVGGQALMEGVMMNGPKGSDCPTAELKHSLKRLTFSGININSREYRLSGVR